MNRAQDARKYVTPLVSQHCVALSDELLNRKIQQHHPDKEAALLLIDALSHIALHGPVRKDLGICGNAMNHIMDRDYDWPYASHITDWIGPAAAKWEHFSGDITYPIKDGNGFYLTNKWEGPSAIYRYRLLAFLLDELTRIVNEEDYSDGTDET